MKPIQDYEGLYSISPVGQVWSHRSSRFLSQSKGEGLYVRVNLCKEGCKTFYVHRLVLETFIGPPPPGKPYALHYDGDPENNHLSNLRWGSPSENTHDKVRHGRVTKPGARPWCKRGHEQGVENTYKMGDYRTCKKCVDSRRKRDREAGLSDQDRRHGTHNGYSNWACRCSECSQAERKYNQDNKRRGK